MVTEHTHKSGRLRGPLATLSRLARLGDVPVVVMLAWAGWLAVPWSFSGLAQARAAAAAAAADATPPPPAHASDTTPPLPALARDTSSPPALASPSAPSAPSGLAYSGQARPASPAAAVPATAWGIPAALNVSPTIRTLHETPVGEELGASAGSAFVPSAADAIALERARIAGEVHDAAGHGLAAIALQAGVALVTLDENPEQARASLQAIRETSLTALTQLRAALDRLDPPRSAVASKSPDDPMTSTNATTPAATLTPAGVRAPGEGRERGEGWVRGDGPARGEDLASLIDGVRATGLAVDVEPATLDVPAHLQDTVYRVVRESLTNVLRHAGPTTALVRASHAPGAFVLEIADQGSGRVGADEGHSGAVEGRGLAGMRARVTAAGGQFAAGPRADGGFRVVATFPQGAA
ncbi:histidine kinase [Nonomuraea sp. NPDC005983]|uniref:sensor histidine kinase n=1 Tax=Nonomuraea sp. NPDC005983 TaxID=3155595 RepID=UPI0033AD94C4